MKTSLFLVSALLAPTLAAQLTTSGTLPVGSEPNAAAFCDIDGDCDLDLAVAVDAPDRVDIYRNDGSGNYSFAQSVFTGGGSSPHTPVAADLDGDGDCDFAISLQNTNQVRVLINNGGVFSLGSSTATGLEPREVIAFDANGDAAMDLATANRDGNNISVLINSGAATFTATTLPAGPDVRGIAAGDIDDNGSTDLIASVHDARRLDLFANNGAGGFVAAGSLSLGFPFRPEDVVAGDLDGDGDTDLATAANGNALNVVSVFIQTSAGIFAAPTNFATGGLDPSGVALLDADVDGDDDILVSNTDSNTVGLLLNSGAGTFGAPTTIGVGVEPGHIAVGDIDGNGSSDAVVTNETGNSLSLLANVNTASAFTDLGFGLAGVAGVPTLSGTGLLASGCPTTVTLTSAATSAPAALIQSLSSAFVPFKGGVLVPNLDAILTLTTSATGSIALSGPFPAGLPSGSDLFLQYIVIDAAAAQGFALSNALQGTTP